MLALRQEHADQVAAHTLVEDRLQAALGETDRLKKEHAVAMSEAAATQQEQTQALAAIHAELEACRQREASSAEERTQLDSRAHGEADEQARRYALLHAQLEAQKTQAQADIAAAARAASKAASAAAQAEWEEEMERLARVHGEAQQRLREELAAEAATAVRDAVALKEEAWVRQREKDDDKASHASYAVSEQLLAVTKERDTYRLQHEQTAAEVKRLAGMQKQGEAVLGQMQSRYDGMVTQLQRLQHDGREGLVRERDAREACGKMAQELQKIAAEKATLTQRLQRQEATAMEREGGISEAFEKLRLDRDTAEALVQRLQSDLSVRLQEGLDRDAQYERDVQEAAGRWKESEVEIERLQVIRLHMSKTCRCKNMHTQ